MSDWAAPSRRSELADALYDAARKPFEKVFQQRDGSDHATFRILAQAAQELEPDDWATHGYNAALRNAARRAISEISDENGSGAHSAMTWREIAATLYGFENREVADKIVVGNNHAYSRRYQVVKNRSFVEDSALNEKVIRPTWRKLADALASLKPSAREIDRNASRKSPQYVSRTFIESEFKAAVDAECRVIAFVGQPGMGKTTLAKEQLRRLTPAYIPVIRWENGVPVTRDIYAALMQCGDEVSPDAIDGHGAALLARLLCGIRAPEFALLDNLDSAKEASSVLPSNTRSVVVVTCRAKDYESEQLRYIEVKRMTTSEATQLVLSRMPSVSGGDAEFLANRLNCYPLLIHHACGLLRYYGIPVAQLCEELEIDDSSALGNFSTDDQSTLLTVLRRTNDGLRAHYFDAHELLKLCILRYRNFFRRSNSKAVDFLPIWEPVGEIAVRDSSIFQDVIAGAKSVRWLNEEVARTFFGAYLGRARKLTRVEFLGIIEALEGSCLVEAKRHGHFFSLDFHPITAILLLSLMETDTEAVLQRYEDACELAYDWLGTWPTRQPQ